MGTDKALVELCGRTLLERTVELAAALANEVIIVGSPARAGYGVPSARPTRFIEDSEPWQGPLVGLVHGLRAAHTPIVLVMGCDTPLLVPSLLRELCERVRRGTGVVMPRPGGQPQPLCAAWSREALPTLEAALAAGERSVIGAARRVGIDWFEHAECERHDPGGRSFLSVDTPQDLLEAHRLLCRSPEPDGSAGVHHAPPESPDEVLRSPE